MLVEAAIHGLGIALVPHFLVEDEVRRGLLIEAGRAGPSGLGYYLVYPEGRGDEGAVQLPGMVARAGGVSRKSTVGDQPAGRTRSSRSEAPCSHAMSPHATMRSLTPVRGR